MCPALFTSLLSTVPCSSCLSVGGPVTVSLPVTVSFPVTVPLPVPVPLPSRRGVEASRLTTAFHSRETREKRVPLHPDEYEYAGSLDFLHAPVSDVPGGVWPICQKNSAKGHQKHCRKIETQTVWSQPPSVPHSNTTHCITAMNHSPPPGGVLSQLQDGPCIPSESLLSLLSFSSAFCFLAVCVPCA